MSPLTCPKTAAPLKGCNNECVKRICCVGGGGNINEGVRVGWVESLIITLTISFHYVRSRNSSRSMSHLWSPSHHSVIVTSSVSCTLNRSHTNMSVGTHLVAKSASTCWTVGGAGYTFVTSAYFDRTCRWDCELHKRMCSAFAIAPQ